MTRSMFYLGYISTIGLSVLTSDAAIAQIVSPDGTLNTTVNRSGNNFTITNGTKAGTHLFHSFREFSIPTNGAAIFDLVNTPNVSTIFSRVTGTTVSNVNGLIRSVNTTNPVSLFLMNPNGIVFGLNAKLNIDGSLIGTTANRIQFQNGHEFNITDPTPLLTIALPIGLQFGSTIAPIQVNGTGHLFTSSSVLAPTIRPNALPPGLRVNPGNTIALVGGDIDLNGGVLSAFGGRIALSAVQNSVGANPVVRLTPDALGWKVGQMSRADALGNIRVDQKAAIDVSGILGASAGQIQVQSRNLSVLGGSSILSQNTGRQSAGLVQLNVREGLTVSGIAANQNFVSQIQSEALGSGAGADLEIQAQTLNLASGGLIRSATFSQALGGKMTIGIQDSLKISGVAPLFPINRSGLLSATLGNAKAGDILVISPVVEISKMGNISATSIGRGNGGNITIEANDITVTDTDVKTGVNSVLATSSVRSGTGGDLLINTQRISVLGGAVVGASTLGVGNAGKVTINAPDSVTVSGFAPLATGAVQRSNINSSGTRADPVTAAILGAPPFPSGNANSVTINTRQLNVSSGGFVRVRNAGTGDGGTLTVNADRVVLKDQGFLGTTTASGNGGNIIVNARDFLLLRRGASINTTAGGAGNGGDIRINAGSVVSLTDENSDIIANAAKGRGGNVQITTQGIFGLVYRTTLTPKSDITASSDFGVNGTVQVNNIGVSPSVGLIALPTDVVDPSRSMNGGCAAAKGNSFVQTGRGGIPKDPAQRNTLNRSWHDLRMTSTAPVPSQPNLVSAAIVLENHAPIEATALSRNAQTGELALIAGKASPLSAPATCGLR